jgi:hypothetical protein
MPAAASKLDAFDVSALEHSLNDSATRVSTIWVSFLIFSLYLLTAVTTVTHRQLLLAEPLKLPVLNIDLPLWGFFFLAPILFVIMHVYVLLQVLLLARTAAAYNTAVEREDLTPEENVSLRQRLTNTMFAQIFAGSPRERTTAELQGANLKGARLQGAQVLAAKLQGADLSGAQLQGVNFSRSELKLALLSDVFLWRAKVGNCSGARTTNQKFDAAVELRPKPSQADEPVPATAEAIAAFIERAIMDLSEPRKDEVRERLRIGLLAGIKTEDLAAIEMTWRECASNSARAERAEYDRNHADILRDLVCGATTDRKEIAAGIIRNWGSDDPDRRDFFIRLARGLLGLDGRECGATKDLSDRAKEFLRNFVSTPAPAS